MREDMADLHLSSKLSKKGYSDSEEESDIDTPEPLNLRRSMKSENKENVKISSSVKKK